MTLGAALDFLDGKHDLVPEHATAGEDPVTVGEVRTYLASRLSESVVLTATWLYFGVRPFDGWQLVPLRAAP